MNEAQKNRILLVGCGKMGSSLLQIWIKKNLIEQAFILDPNGLPPDFKGETSVSWHKSAKDINWPTLDLCILAVKPQIMGDVCRGLSQFIPPDTPLLSIAAGQTLERLQSYFNHENQPLIRSMPNTPASIGKGMSAAIASHSVSRETIHKVETLLEAAGRLIWLKDESQMDGVTAVSGSGPAYVFHLIEVLSHSAEKLGFSKEDAILLARETVIGAAALIKSGQGIEASTLRKNVTSPGGTTEAALSILMDGRLQELFDEALLAAQRRGQELS
ncbi:MAG: pyrroline-5-carboxylate reductase [Pseudomonadota bacterium]